jgi:hypothetical protein
MARDLAYWRNLTLAATTGFTAEQVEAVAQRLVAADKGTEISSVWHEVSIVLGKPCQCARCNPGRRFI